MLKESAVCLLFISEFQLFVYIVMVNYSCLCTLQAYNTVKSEALTDDPTFGPSSMDQDQLAEKVDRAKEKEEETKLSPKVSIMKPILRFLQLLCENHNRHLQNLLRDQIKNKSRYNLVSETLILLDVICGSTTGGLGLLGLYINENNVMLINQILETLTEYCQVQCTHNSLLILQLFDLLEMFFNKVGKYIFRVRD